jgi:adenylate kinase
LNIILLGSPGSGKGTQAEALTKRLAAPCVSTGNMLREAVRRNTPLGASAKGYIDDGQLVPDSLMVDIIRERLKEPDCAEGFILDGFPRTLPQAEALESIGVEIDAVLSLEVPDEDIESRMAGRRSCKACGSAYHVERKPPRNEGVCDLCGGGLFRRDDDNPETVRARLSVYHENTEPLKGYYEEKGKLIAVPARDSIAKITARCLEALGFEA